jgi:hypothetical protein
MDNCHAALVILWAFFPILLGIGIYVSWVAAIAILAIKWMIDGIFIFRSYRQLHLRADMTIWIYPFYCCICNTVFLVYQCLPIPVQWKGRKFKKPYDKGPKSL